jgi:hypothetical protein
MSKRTILTIVTALIVVVAWWNHRHGGSSNASSCNATGRRGGGTPVPLVAGKADPRDMPVYLVSDRSLMNETKTVEARL